VLYDMYHMHRMGEDVAAQVTANLELISHLHVAGAPRRDFPGPHQEMDYASIVRAVHSAGFRGFWGQEFLPAGEPLEALAAARGLFDSWI
jgi:hydroxypyruvate isomerase